MFKHILFATDLSIASDHVAACLQGLRPLGAEKVTLFHALGIRHLDAMRPLLVQSAEPKLVDQRKLIEQQGYAVDVDVATGLPIPEITQAAVSRQVSAIVIGSHGHSLSREVLLGGVASGVVHHASVPVLVIEIRIVETEGGSRCEEVCHDFCERVLFATDFSDTSERAFGCVEKLVERGAKNIALVHVQDQTCIEPHLKDRVDEFNEVDRGRLGRMKARLEELGATNVQCELPYGSPLQEILSVAKRFDPTLIVMGSQGRGFIPEVFLGSVSHHVVRHATTPVLLVPALRE